MVSQKLLTMEVTQQLKGVKLRARAIYAQTGFTDCMGVV
jgi:hypothetical protein